MIPDPGVQIGINEVDEEVVQQNDAGEKQVDPGDHRVIPVREGIHQETAQAWQVKEVLHDDGAPDHERQLQADQGDDRDEGIFDGVSQHDRLFLEPLGPGSADIVLPQYLQHHGARHAHGAGRKGRSQNQAGNDQDPQVAPRVFGKRHQLHRGRPAPPDGRVDHYHNAQPEVGGGQAEDSEDAPRVVRDRILATFRFPLGPD